MSLCVCGTPRTSHFMGFGPCNDREVCGCPRFEEDDGGRTPESSVSSGRASFDYTGPYSKHFTLEDECSA